MWDEIDASTLVNLAAVAFAVVFRLAFLKGPKARIILIVVWTALPCVLVFAVGVATAFARHSFDAAAFFGFTAVFSLAVLPPWAFLTLLPYNLVMHLREGISYRTGS